MTYKKSGVESDKSRIFRALAMFFSQERIARVYSGVRLSPDVVARHLRVTRQQVWSLLHAESGKDGLFIQDKGRFRVDPAWNVSEAVDYFLRPPLVDGREPVKKQTRSQQKVDDGWFPHGRRGQRHQRISRCK